eukprot:TRINITY_DN112830_c0_g1_i1.p1 TRINITY_DN112830_c0_g1~~TRINITY_DN112830_c0_g1_i1.p1  ORF type:complete len:387 (-),score=65.02 TRINITY_DN112830_c0_g1_i1:154-1314(-)
MSEPSSNNDLIAVELWRLPTNFFALDSTEQWKAMAEVTVPATRLSQPRQPCKLSLQQEVTAVAYFVVILGLPLAVPLMSVGLLLARSPYLKWWILLVALLASHPIPPYQAWYRRNSIGVILAKYFTMTFIFDKSQPDMKHVATPLIEADPAKSPIVTLACPHGVLNFGAIIWVFFSRWLIGLEQYTAGASVVTWVPGLRYLCASLWIIPVDRKSLKRALQETPRLEDKHGKRFDTDVPRRGGMVGIVPDGIAGIFKSKPGSEGLFIGKKRGLMRICLEEGALIAGGWFAGTSDLFHIVTDPFGILEWLSRRMHVSVFLFFGRWGLPIPRRTPLTLCSRAHRCKKVESPTEEQVQQLHDEVYGGLERSFNSEARHFTGYPDRTLVIY